MTRPCHLLLTAIGLITCLLAGIAQAQPGRSLPALSPRALVEQAEAAVRGDPEASRKFAEQALERLATASDIELELRARFILCDYFAEQNPLRAREQAKLGLAQAPRSTRLGWKAAFVLCQAAADDTEAHSSAARAGYDEAVRLAEGAEDSEFLAYSLFHRGYLLGLSGEYVAGLVDLRRAHVLYQKLEKPEHRRTTLNAIATLYNRMGDYAQAKLYYRQSIALLENGARKRDLGVAQHNLARVHENLHEWKEAREAYERTLSLHGEIHYTRGMAYAHRGLASVYNGQSMPARAMAEIELARKLSAGMDDVRLQAQIGLQHGIALRQLGRLADSIAELETTAGLFEQAQAMFELRDTYGALAQSFADAGDWHAAYEREIQYKKISDRLLAGQLDQRFAWLRAEFDSNAKDQENALLQREKAASNHALREERRANQLLIAVAILAAVLLLLLSHMFWRVRRSHLAAHALAMTDELTGLPNRRDALARLGLLLTRQDQARPAILIADLDLFKRINDDYGHLVGDAILQAVARALRQAVGGPVLLGRLGGEEFIVILPETTLADALDTAERIRIQVAAIDTSRWFADRTLTISLGVTLAHLGVDTLSSVLRRADQALYAAKDKGRNRVELILPDT